MLEALTKKKMMLNLKKKFGNETKTIGILFCNPNTEFTKSNILDRIGQFHHASSRYINFYFPGYGAYWNNEYPDQRKVCNFNGTDWYYSDKAYREFINSIEEISKWEYQGESELLILDYKGEELDFSNCIRIALEREVREGNIDSVAILFEKTFRALKAGVTVSALSDLLCAQGIFDTTRKVIIDKLGIPGNLYKNSVYRVTRDLRK